MFDVTVIGAAIIDILAQPVSAKDLGNRSFPAECTRMAVGGDAANESTTLARLGKKVNLITKLGNDLPGNMLLNHFQQLNVSTADSALEDDLMTGINIVLVREDAERSFITNKNGSLRKLALSDISLDALKKSPLVCYASIFTSPCLSIQDMAVLFKAAKDAGCTLCADMTRCKNGETVEDLREAIQYLDYIFPNYAEAQAVTNKTDLDEMADALLDCGVSCVVIKTGGDGCFIKTKEERMTIPAYPGTKCIDTTGAGDNFAAGFLYGISEGMSLEDCGRFATATASVAVEHVGACTGVTSPDIVLERFQNMPHAERSRS